MSDPADDVAAMTKPATARPAMTPPDELPAQTANTKMATCSVVAWVTYLILALLCQTEEVRCSRGMRLR